MVEFIGVEPWTPDIEIVECVVDGEIVDLHNAATLTQVEILCQPHVELVLRFVLEDGRAADLVFGAVTDLVFRQDEADGRSPFAAAWNPADVETFYGVEYHERTDGAASFEVNSILGSIVFVGRTVRFFVKAD